MTGDNVHRTTRCTFWPAPCCAEVSFPLEPLRVQRTPLFAGFNAGALYPWWALRDPPRSRRLIATEVILFSLIAVGMYVFLPPLALSTTACMLRPHIHLFGSRAEPQANHVDMTEGFASIPFMLCGVARRDGRLALVRGCSASGSHW